MGVVGGVTGGAVVGVVGVVIVGVVGRSVVVGVVWVPRVQVVCGHLEMVVLVADVVSVIGNVVVVVVGVVVGGGTDS